MLNFTYSSTDVEGQFNGRFAFRAALDASPLSLTDFQALSEDKANIWTNKVLLHEFFHWKVFCYSKIGVELIGRRYHARRTFARGEIKPVIDYYIARTCYFCTVYQCHEDIVFEIEKQNEKKVLEQNNSVNLKKKQIRAIVDSDHKAKINIARLGVKRHFFGSVLDLFQGLILTREYSLQDYTSKDGKIQLRETSMKGPTKGIINAAFGAESKSQSSFLLKMKAFRRLFNIEQRTGTYTKKRLAIWAIIKLQTEYATLQRIFDEKIDCTTTSIDSADSYFKNNYSQTIDFILRHTMVKTDQLLVKLYMNRLLECAKNTNNLTPIDIINNLSELDESFLYFFFCHGN